MGVDLTTVPSMAIKMPEDVVEESAEPVEAGVASAGPLVALWTKEKAHTLKPTSVARKEKSVDVTTILKKKFIPLKIQRELPIGVPTILEVPTPKQGEEGSKFGDDAAR